MPRPVLEWERRLGRRLTLRDLYILKTVVQSGSMAKAARGLAMTQPSVSEAIAKLEAALRVPLLDRGPRGVQPTIYADALLRRERIVSDELQQGIRDIEFLSNPTAGEVRIGCPENLACGFVPTAIDRMSRRYPKVAFHVMPVEPAAMGFRELRERSVDLMIGRILNPPLDNDLEADVLFQDRLVVVAGAGSPWARRRKVAIKDLLDAPWVGIPQDNAVSAYQAAALRSRGPALPLPVVSTYSMHVRSSLLATDRYLAVLWEWTLHFTAGADALKVLPIDLGIPARPVATVKLRKRTLSPVVQLFVEHAKELATSMIKSGKRETAPRE
jgi:DNA-binding transcriptional LysR family regulator